MIMRARRDGEPEPTELPPEVKARLAGGGGGGRRSTGGAPSGFGSSDIRENETAVERERRLRQEASDRLKAKGFKVGRGMGGSRMGGIGSDGRSFVPPGDGGSGLVFVRLPCLV